jgi:hypothetical protein
MSGALDTTKTLFARLEAEDWIGAARLFNPLQVAEWYRALLQQQRPADQEVGLTVEQYLKHSPDMPRQVAEYHIAQMRRDHASRSPSDELAGITAWEEAEKLDPVQAYGLHLQTRDPRQQLRRAVISHPPSETALAEMGQIPVVHRILGAVEETQSSVHVVYRQYWGEHDHGTLHLLTCSNGAQWMIEITPEWEMAQLNHAIWAEAFDEE